MILRLRSGSVTPASLPRKRRLGVDADEVDVPLPEGCLDLVALVLAHQAVVHEDAGELTADGLCEQRRGNGAVHAAGQGQQHLAVADLLADVRRWRCRI